MKKMMTVVVVAALSAAFAGCCSCGSDKTECCSKAKCECVAGKPCSCGDKCNCAKEAACACDKGKDCTCCADHAKCACKHSPRPPRACIGLRGGGGP